MTGAARRMVLSGASIGIAAWLVACGAPTPTNPSTPTPTPTGMLVTGSAPSVGNSSQLTANVSLSDRTSIDVTGKATWQSSDTTVATVNGTGLVTGMKVGTADITATYQGVLGKLPVAVETACALTVQPSDVTFPAAGGSVTLTVTVALGPPCSWAAQLDQGFLSFVGANGGTGSGAITVKASANAGASRSGSLTLLGRVVTLRQSQAPCVTAVSPGSQLFSAAGGSSTATVSAPAFCTWTVDNTSSFVTITSGASGTGPGTFTYSVAGNGGGSRQATLGVEQYSFALTQAGANPTTTYLNFVSDPGDYIGKGATFSVTSASVPFVATTDTAFNHVSITVNIAVDGGPAGPGSIWLLNFAAPKGQPLAFGTYSNATRYPFQAATAPGLSFLGNGAGCNTVTGSFQVLVADFGPGPIVNRFWATFEHHCEGAAPAARGEISIVR